MPPVTCHTRLGRAALSWSERHFPAMRFIFFLLLLLLLFEFVIKGGSEGWKETLQESKFILDSGERKIKLSGGVGESPPLNTKSRNLGESKGLGEGGLDTCLPAVLQAGRSCAPGPAVQCSSTPTFSRAVTPPHALPRGLSRQRRVPEVRRWSKARKGQQGTPNTDSPRAGGGRGDTAQILSSQKKKKMARNRNRESCQLEAG